MSEWQHIALMPLGNAGFLDSLVEFDWSCGAKVRLAKNAHEIQPALKILCDRTDLSDSEKEQFKLARGWLWITANQKANYHNTLQICFGLATTVWNLCLLSEIAGAGENWYWRAGPIYHCCGVYTASTKWAHTNTLRKPFLYSTHKKGISSHPWNKDVFTLADSYEQNIRSNNTQLCPRIALATHTRCAMMSFDAKNIVQRFQLCITALETLFIARSERQYIWNDEIIERIRQICPSYNKFNEYPKRVNQLRNDAVHRAGIADKKREENIYSVIIESEILLREALQTIYANYKLFDESFEKDEWPKAII